MLNKRRANPLVAQLYASVYIYIVYTHGHELSGYISIYIDIVCVYAHIFKGRVIGKEKKGA